MISTVFLPAMTMFRSARCAALIAFAMGCGHFRNAVPSVGGVSRTEERIIQLRLGIEEYVDAHAEPPEQLSQLCPSMDRADCLWLLPRWRYEDGWGRPLLYRKQANDYEVRSLGPDGRPDTSDDIVVSSAAEREAIRATQGCYDLRTAHPALAGHRLDLLPAKKYPGWYTVGTELPNYYEPRWTVTRRGTVVVIWQQQHSALELTLQRDNTELRGTVRNAGISLGGSDDVDARRSTCPPPQ